LLAWIISKEIEISEIY